MAGFRGRVDPLTCIVGVVLLTLSTFVLQSYYYSENHHNQFQNPQLQQGRSNNSPNQFKIPIFNREGKSVVARFDVNQVEITEMNITTKYIENGKEKKMDLFVMGTSTNPPFAAVIANPHTEAASWDLWKNGDMEIPTRKMFEFMLNNRCKNGNHLVVDAGANLGYFSTYSAIMGCRVISFEPQPRLLPIINTSRLVNGIQDRMTLHNNIVHIDSNERLKITYASGVCTGCSVVTPAGPDEQNTENSFIIQATRIDTKVKEDVLLMKVDVEGYEVLAIESASGLFEKYNVQNILVEWFPSRFPHGPERGTKLLEDLSDKGYKIRHYDLRMKLPRDWVLEETFPVGGKTWLVPKNRLADMNSFLMKDSYGEANFWISKEL